MISMVADLRMGEAIKARPAVPSCAVRFGRVNGKICGFEPWIDGWCVLHVSDLDQARALAKLAGSGAKGLAVSPAKAALGASWPSVAVVDADGKPIGSEPAGVPHIAGHPARDSWTDGDKQIGEISAARAIDG